MQYALVNNGYVRFGPTDWNTRIFNSVLNDELNIDYRVSIAQESNAPLVINDSTKILPVRTEVQGEGGFGREAAGPIWTVADSEAVAVYTWRDRSVDTVKRELKAQVAADRYRKQDIFITVTVNGTEVSVRADKATKDELVSAIADGVASRNWKFSNTWVTVDNAALQSVVDAIATHVQTQFDWEAAKVSDIDSKTTLAELETFVQAYQLELNPPPSEETPGE